MIAGVGGLAAMRRRAAPTVSADSAARDAAAAAVQPEEEQPWLQRVGEPPNLDPPFPQLIPELPRLAGPWLVLWYILGFQIPQDFPGLPPQVQIAFNILSVGVLWYKCK